MAESGFSRSAHDESPSPEPLRSLGRRLDVVWKTVSAVVLVLVVYPLAGSAAWAENNPSFFRLFAGVLAVAAVAAFAVFLHAEVARRFQAQEAAANLWDRWLDAESEQPPEPEAEELRPRAQRAYVRPRILSPNGEPLPLEDELRPMLATGLCGAVFLAGSEGSGKSTALEHAEALWDTPGRLCVLDDPSPETVATLSADRLVLYTADAHFPRKHLASYSLAPWSRDEVIEYLLAAQSSRCGSVMTRLTAADDGAFLEGIPALWALILDRMIADDSPRGAREALLQGLLQNLTDPSQRTRVRRLCLVSWLGPEQHLAASYELDRIPEFALLARHRPTRLILAADAIAAGLDGREDYGDAHLVVHRSPALRLPQNLILEAGSLISENSAAQESLRRILKGDRTRHAMAASLLHASHAAWQPSPGEPLVLSGAYLRQVDWPGLDLSSGHFAWTDLSEANLSGANLTSADLRHTCFLRARLHGASLTKCMADSADFGKADLTESRAGLASFQYATFTGANLEGTSLNRADLRSATLTGARLAHADLAFADLREATLDRADFTDANLEAACLSHLNLAVACFREARFGGADLSHAQLEGVELPAADFEDADLSQALLTGSQMPGANFLGANLRATGLAEIDWAGACLRDADLRGASFHLGSSRSGLVQSSIAGEGSRTGFYTDDFDDQGFKSPEEIRKANLEQADLRGALIDGVDFYLVDLRGAQLDREQFEHVRACGAIL